MSFLKTDLNKVGPQRTPGGKGMIGSSFSQFKVTSKLGEGGMGVVYEAYDVKLGRPVALKILPMRLARQELYLKRFIREAQAAAQQ